MFTIPISSVSLQYVSLQTQFVPEMVCVQFQSSSGREAQLQALVSTVLSTIHTHTSILHSYVGIQFDIRCMYVCCVSAGKTARKKYVPRRRRDIISGDGMIPISRRSYVPIPVPNSNGRSGTRERIWTVLNEFALFIWYICTFAQQ